MHGPSAAAYSIETPHASTLDTEPDLRVFLPPIPAPVTAVYCGDHHASFPSTYRPFSPPLLKSPAQRARPNDQVRTQSLTPRHKKRRAKALESLTQQSLYHSLPTNDREYFHQVTTSDALLSPYHSHWRQLWEVLLDAR